MATLGGYGFAEAYVTRKLYKEKLKKKAPEEEGKKTNMAKICTVERDCEKNTSSGCFSWVSNQSKSSRISDYNHVESANWFIFGVYTLLILTFMLYVLIKIYYFGSFNFFMNFGCVMYTVISTVKLNVLVSL